MPSVDFAAVKAAVSFEDAISFLKLPMKKEGKTYRAKCPACQKGDARSLAVTPGEGAYCHAQRKGGDVIWLVAHVLGCGQRQAAEQLQEVFLSDGSASAAPRKSTSDTRNQEPAPDGLEPLDHLTTDHPVIEMLGLSETACQALGIGYTDKGMMARRIVVPLRLPDGTLTGYLGVATEPDQEPLLKFPNNLDQRVVPKAEKPKPDAEALRKMFRVVA